MKWIVSLAATACSALAGWYVGSAPTPTPLVQPAKAAAIAATPGATPTGDGGLLDRASATLQKTRSLSETQFALFEEARHLSSPELGSAIALMAQGNKNLFLAQDLAGYWAEVDLPAARDWLLRLGEKERAIFAPAIGRTWAAMDPIALIDWLDTLPPDTRRTIGGTLVDILGSVAGKRAPERVNAILISLPSPDEKAADFTQLYTAWADQDPSTASRQALAVQTSASRAAAVSGVAKAWAEKDPAAALAWVEGIGDAILAAGAQVAYARGLSGKHPEEAVKFLSDLPLTEENQNAFTEVLSGWVTRDAKAALRFADAYEDSETRGVFYNQMFSALAIRDVETAARSFIERRESFSTWSNALSSISWRLGETGIEPLQAFAEQLDPEKAKAVYRQGIGGWVEQDRRAAEKWALQQPEGPARAETLRSLSLQQMARSPADALAWAAKLPSGPSSDPALGNVGLAVMRNHPEQAVVLSRRLSNPDAGREALERWIETWILREPAKAKQWVRTSNSLPPEIRQRFTREGAP